MPKAPALTPEQLKAIDLIADGMTKNAAAQVLGCNKSTIGRWAKQEAFASELEAEKQRRNALTKEKFQQAADAQIESSVDDFKAEMETFHKAIVNVQMQRLARGKKLIEKAYQRLLDAPDKDLSMADAIKILDSADRMFDKGLTDWGNAIAMEDVLKRLSDGG